MTRIENNIESNRSRACRVAHGFMGFESAKTGMKIREEYMDMIDMEHQGLYMCEPFIRLWSIETIESKNEIYMYSDSYEKLEKHYGSVKVR